MFYSKNAVRLKNFVEKIIYISFFAELNPEYNQVPQDIIVPLPEALATGQKPIYKQVLYSDCVRHFFKKAHSGKKTVDVAKI